MEVLRELYIFVLLIGLTLANQRNCFTFNNNSYLKFNLLNFVNNDDAHYTMKFATREPNGLLMYSRGSYGDDEALYIRDGRLSYHLFNLSPTGVEGYFGGLFQGDIPVNTGDEIYVETYRAYNVTDEVQRRTLPQTGLVYTVAGQTYSHVDFRPRSDIVLSSDVFIGGYESKLSDTVGNFTGQIWEIEEKKNDKEFINFSLNVGEVTPSCLPGSMPA